MSATSVALIAALAAQRKKLLEHFVSVGAVSPESAVPRDSVPSALFGILERLREEKVICMTSEGNLYLDQEWAAEWQARKNWMAIKVLVGTVALIAAGLVLWALA